MTAAWVVDRMRTAVGARVAGKARSQVACKEEQGPGIRKDFYRVLETTSDGQSAMGISVSNWQTSEEDVIKTVAGVERVLTRMR